MHIINYNGQLYTFTNNIDENNNTFIERCWFIVKNMYKINQMKINYTYLENISYIWINIKYYGVIYNKNIMDELSHFME